MGGLFSGVLPLDRWLRFEKFTILFLFFYLFFKLLSPHRQSIFLPAVMHSEIFYTLTNTIFSHKASESSNQTQNIFLYSLFLKKKYLHTKFVAEGCCKVIVSTSAASLDESIMKYKNLKSKEFEKVA